MTTPSGGRRPDNFLAGLTNFQWYFYQARQTVFYAAFTNEAPTPKRLNRVVADLLEIAPQLAEGFAGLHVLDADDPEALARLTQLHETDDLAAYPEAFDVFGDDIFRQKDLPVFRVTGIVRKGGPDEHGRAGAICIVASHSLLEGVDSVQFSRSQTYTRNRMRPVQPVSWLKRATTRTLAWLVAPLQLVVAAIIAPRRVDHTYRALRISRARIRAAAEKLGISQRSLIFALAMFALNDHGRGFSRRNISATYVDLDPSYQGTSADNFFRFRMMEAKFRVEDDFVNFAKGVDRSIAQVLAKDATATQRFLTALFGAHRWLKHKFPFLYPEWIFRFAGFYHLDLSLTPPHRLSGPMTENMLEPLYCGTLHPALNICVFVPSGMDVTFNFTVRNRLAKHVTAVNDLLDNLLQDGDAAPKPGQAAKLAG